MMRRLAVVAGVVASVLVGCASVRIPASEMRNFHEPSELGVTGDLVFLDLDCGEACDAIESVTLEQFGVAGPRLSHVGILLREGDDVFVLEAWPRGGVIKTSWSAFVSRAGGPDAVRWRHLRPTAHQIGLRAAEIAQQWLGRPYDDRFALGDQAFYCSELVMRAYASAAIDSGAPPFAPSPMRFGISGSAANSYWTDYYDALAASIPEGAPGISPLGIYLRGEELFE